jgi:hypothetical protein
MEWRPAKQHVTLWLSIFVGAGLTEHSRGYVIWGITSLLTYSWSRVLLENEVEGVRPDVCMTNNINPLPTELNPICN